MPLDLEQVLKKRIIPVVAIHDADNANPLADALIQGGLPCAEITFRTDAALSVMTKLSGRDDILVGAGTVLNLESAKAALDAGAGFIVSPGFNPNVVQFCLERSIPVIPGICTPTDLMMAMELSLGLVKFFPAESMGGLKTLKAISAPFPSMKFIPTGGINARNLSDYLSYSKIPAVGGSWMVLPSIIAEKRFDEIEQQTKEAMAIVESIGSA
jgi:2-dehydro-3-deoxyphosphogluconate aldolase/(4S)-4-hydroxy-2-oxoglutarate aldolase